MTEPQSDTGVAVEDSATIRRAFGCGDALARTIAGLGRIRFAVAGVQLYPKGALQDTVLLLAGQAHEVAYGRGGAILVLHQLTVGEFYGALVALDAANGATVVESLTMTRGAQFDQAVLIRLMESYPCVGLAVAAQLARRLEVMRQRMVETVLLTATGRICAELARLAQLSPDHVIRPLPVFAQLAVKAQTTRETVSRTVSQLERSGILKRTSNGLLLVAPHRLDAKIY